MNKTSSETKWYSEGLKFQCQGSGNCCVSHGEYGFVYLDLEDRRRFAKHLGLKTHVFTKLYCQKTDGYFHLKLLDDNPACLFLKNNKCSVYHARPTQCRTWPFWPDVLNAKTWRNDVARFCPGVGKGPTHSLQEIEKVVAEQKASDQKL